MTNAHEEDAMLVDGFEDLRLDAPVFEIDQNWYDSDEAIPGIWITQPVFSEEGESVGRTYVMVYPWEDMPDPDGDIALSFGADYYREAMSYTDAEDHETRVSCFQAAEILYLHAASKGNPIAYANLGYVYSYDRCEGRYFVDHRHSETIEDYARPYPREQRAFECFTFAANAGDAEACYKLGDMYKRGIGCEANPDQALAWYKRAFDLRDGYPASVWGSIALRLASCFEEGIGCDFDLAQALKWYKQAIIGLEQAVREGDSFYTRTLSNAQAAAKRIEQELNGAY